MSPFWLLARFKAWVRSRSSITPEDFGAIGDGVNDDTPFLVAALATGRRVNGKGPGSTYLCRHPLNLNAGQILDGNGATLKRPAQAVTTTTSAINSGATIQIVVAALSGGTGAGAWSLKVGDFITVEKSGIYDGTARQISAIDTNTKTITVSTPFVFTSASGTVNVRHAYWQIQVGAAHARVRNLTVDGNSANWSWNRTWLSAGILSYAGSDGMRVKDCVVINQPGDGIQVGLARGIHIKDNWISDCKGRGICWAGTSANRGVGNRCINNYIYNADLDSTADTSPDGASHDGHGCIQLSSYEGKLLIHGNYMENGIIGIGSVSSTDNSDITITDNDIVTMSSYAIEGDTFTGAVVSNVLISENRIYDTAGILAQVSGAGNVIGPTRWTLSNNILHETIVKFALAAQVIIEGNHFYSAGTTKDFVTLDNGGASSTGTSYATVKGNTFLGGHSAVVPAQFDGQVTIEGNIMANQNLRGVQSATGAVDLKITGNTIINGAASDAANWMAIRMRGGAEATNNTINMTYGSCYGGIIVAADNNNVVRANKIKGTGSNGTAPYRIQIQGGTKNYVLDNILDTPIIDSGTGTVKRGNSISTVEPESGRAVLVGGTATVTTGAILTGANVILTRQVAGGTLGQLSIGTITNATSFTIVSDNAADTSIVYWEIR